MVDEAYKQFYTLLETRTGICLDETKQYLVDSRLADLSKHHQHTTVPGFLKTLTQTTVGELHWNAFEALTTNETMFFRDRAIFDVLSSLILPKLVQKREKEKRLRISCSAVSTGQEAYSLAILLNEKFPKLKDWGVLIQATDICSQALDRARLGIYTRTEVERGLDAHLIGKYFTEVERDKFQVSQSLRESVTFLPTNLLHAPPEYPKFDLIMLRNVLIYFRQQTKDLVLKRIHSQLQPQDGVLILGATESILENPLFKIQTHGKLACYTAV
jgi:chemotaxis protein methyltransferase CheR